MSKIQPLTRTPTLALRQRKARLLRTFQLSPEILHASLAERYMKCGKANCHCHSAGPKHGPFFYLNRCFAKGQMQSLLLKTPDQVEPGAPQPGRLRASPGVARSDQPNQPRTAPPRQPAPRGRFMNELAQFLTYVIKVFALNRVVHRVRDSRPHPVIPTRPLLLSLLLGVVLRVGSYLDLAKQTKRRRWQHLIRKR